MQLPKRVVEAVRSCRWTPPQNSSAGSITSIDLDSTNAARQAGRSRRRVWRCLLWALEACVLLLFCLGLVILVEFVVVCPRPPVCDVVTLNLTRFSASNSTSLRQPTGTTSNLSYSYNTSKNNYGNGSAGEHGPIQLLTAVIVVVLRASNEIERIGTFYDHVHVRVLYNGEVVGEGMVGPFFQGRKVSNLLQTQVEAHKLPVRHATGKQLLADIHDHLVDFQVKVHVRTRVSLLKYFTHHFRVHVWCDMTVMIVKDVGGTNTADHLHSSSNLVSKQCRRKD